MADIVPMNNAVANKGVGTEMVSSQQTSQMQMAMWSAKMYPRDTYAVEKRILDDCKRVKLAETAMYSYKRGSSKVEGPSIRLAEAIAQNYQNIEAGVVELERHEGYSTVMSYAWDLETNFRDTKVFTVRHERKAKGSTKKLTDERDIYELIANMGARRKRANLLAVLPGDLVEMAVDECKKTLTGNNKEPLSLRVSNALKFFDESFGIKKDQVEEKFGYNIEAFSEHDYLQLRNIFNSIKDGLSSIEDHFGKAQKKKVVLDSPEPEKVVKKADAPPVEDLGDGKEPY